MYINRLVGTFEPYVELMMSACDSGVTELSYGAFIDMVPR